MSSYKELSKMVQSQKLPETAAKPGTAASKAVNSGPKKVSTSYMAEKFEQDQQPALKAATPKETDLVSITKQRAREQQVTLRDKQRTAAEKRDEAKALYDSYIQSDEYKQNLAANMKAQTDEWMNATLAGSTGYTPTPRKDQKEQELKALVDHYTAQMEKEANEATLTQAMQELEEWDEADRAALETYIMNRNQEFGTNMNPMTTGTFGQEAVFGSRELIEKYGLEKINKMAEALEWQQSTELAEWAGTKGKNQAGETFFDNMGADIASIGAKGLGNLTGLYSYVQELGQRTGQFSTLNPNNIGQLPNIYGDAIQSQKTENLAADGGKLDAYLYQGGMSAADSALRMAMGGGAAGGAVLSATGSFARAVSEASSRGASPAEAVALGIVNAGIEYATEKVPLDKLMDAAKAGGHGWKDIVKNALIQGGIEAGEEELSLIGATLAEAAILREQAGHQQRINELVSGGMGLQEAQNTALGELIQEAKETAIVSALSVGLSEAGASITGNLSNPAAKPQQDTENAAPVQQEAPVAAPVAQTEQERTSQAMEETAAQWGREVPQEAKPEKTEAELGIDRAYEVTMGVEQKPAEQLTPQERGIRYKASKINGAIMDMIGRVKSGGFSLKEKVQMGTVPESNAARIKELTGVDVTGFDMALEARQVDHILKRHGEKGKGDRSMANPEDIARMEYVLENPDDIRRGGKTNAYTAMQNGKSRPADTVLYETQLSDNSYYIVQAVPDTKKKTLYVVTAFMGEPGYKKTGSVSTPESAQADSITPEATGGTAPRTEALQSTNTADPGATPEAESTVTPEGATQPTDISSPDATSETAAAGASTNSVPQRKPEVNGNIDERRAQGADTQRASAEGGQTESAYETVMTEGNVQPDRADDVRKMAMPETDINENPVSQTAGNVYASKITPDDFAELMKEPAAKGKLSYAKITNDQAVEWAKETILKAGYWKTAYSNWKDSVANGVAGAEMSARGALLLNHAAREGDKDLWQNILLDVQRLGTNTAQGLQAYRILRSLDPESKVEMTDKIIQRMVNEMRLGSEIKADEALLEKFRNAKNDEERDAILSDIQQNIADQIPSTVLDKFTALRYMNMLGNLKTNARNIDGNLAMKGVYKLKDTTAAAVENILSVVSGGKFQRTKALTVSSDLRKACAADFAQFAEVVGGGGKYGDSMSAGDKFAQGVMDKRRIFKGDVKTGHEKFDKAANRVIDAALSPAEGYRKATNWMMNNKYFGDEAFGRGAYARAMAGYLKANGVKGADLSTVNEGLLDKARAYAIREAQEATFHDNTALARIVKNGQKNLGIVGEGIMPFTKTPANVLVRAEEFSPLGLINSTVKSLQSAASETKLAEKSGRVGEWARRGREITGADIVNSWAKTLTGTALFALGAFMKDQGLLTASADDDEEKAAFDKLNGEQEYAIVLPDGTSYTMDWLGPAVMPVFMGAELAQAIEEAGGLDEMTLADWEDVLTSVSDPLLQMSMLSGLNDSLSNIKYSDNSLVQLCINAAMSYLTQGLGNTLLGQIEKSTEKVGTQTYIDKDSQTPQWLQRQLGSLSQKIPGWDYQQTPYIDARGREQEQPTDAGGWLYNLISPGYLDKKEVDSVSKELYRLNDMGVTDSNVFLDSPSTTFSYTDKDGVGHEDYSLSAEEAENLKRVAGQNSTRILSDMFKSHDYQKLTDEQKAKAIEYAYDYARELGRTSAVANYPELSGWMHGITDREGNVIMRKVAGESLASAITELNTAWDNGWDDGAGEEALETAYMTYKSMGSRAQEDILEEAGSGVRKYLEAREHGMEQEDYLDVTHLLDGITGTGSVNKETGERNVRDIDNWQAIAGTDLSDSDKDFMMKLYMTDYNPDAAAPVKTELKYDYARQELGLTAEQFTEAYSVELNGGKKAEKKAAWKDMGYTQKEVDALYNLFSATGKGKIDVEAWAEELYG